MLSAVREFKKRKQEVLSLYDEYMTLVSEKRVEPPQSSLKRRMEELREDRLIIAVCGEVKAGKSTFINALVGEEALPTDRLQKSSVLIEVRAAASRSLVVEFGDGHKEVIYDEGNSEGNVPFDAQTAAAQLNAYASLQDEYRDLPVTVIEDYILRRKSRRKKDLLQEVIAVVEAHPSQSHSPADQGLIEQFLNERGSPKQIPVRITLSLPLPYEEFSDLRIVDTPGVNAIGGVQDRTYQFIDSAHATLFVHNIKNTASESFKRFLDAGLSERSLKSAFLVLTHAGDLSEQDRNGYLEQMGRDFPDFQGRMIPVDSELHLIDQMLESGMTLKHVKEHIRERNDGVKRNLMAVIRDWADDSERPVEELVREQANFEALEKAVRRFASDAPMAALNDALSSVAAQLETAWASLDSQVRMLKKKLRSPQEFEQDLDRTKKELHRYEREIGDFTDFQEGLYMGQESSWRSKFEDIQNSFNSYLARLKTTDEVRKLFSDTDSIIDTTFRAIVRQVRTECESKLQELGGAFTDVTTYQPPQIDFASLEQTAEKKAEVQKPLYESYEEFSFAFWGWDRPFHITKTRESGSETVIDEDKRIQTLKGTLLESFSESFDEIARGGGLVETTVRSYLRSVAAEGKRLVAQREQEQDAIKKRKETNEEMASRIDDLSGQQAGLSALIDRIKTATANL